MSSSAFSASSYSDDADSEKGCYLALDSCHNRTFYLPLRSRKYQASIRRVIRNFIVKLLAQRLVPSKFYIYQELENEISKLCHSKVSGKTLLNLTNAIQDVIHRYQCLLIKLGNKYGYCASFRLEMQDGFYFRWRKGRYNRKEEGLANVIFTAVFVCKSVGRVEYYPIISLCSRDINPYWG